MDRFGDYILLEKIASGGMADIFRAVKIGARGFRKYVAIKRILAPISEDKAAQDMFVKEAHVLSSISHPNVVQIYELGEEDGRFYIVMDYIEGKDLKTFLRKVRASGAALSLEVILYVFSKIIDGLEYVHGLTDHNGRSLNLVHRDINPHNVFISYSGEIKIIDFGIVKSAFDQDKTGHGIIKGKISYLTPEQLDGRDVDQRTDIFAVGNLLYEMLAGKRLFTGRSEAEILKSLINLDIEKRVDQLPIDDALADILKKCLARNPEERYQEISRIKRDLIAYMKENSIRFSSCFLLEVITRLFHDQMTRESTIKAQCDRLFMEKYKESPAHNRRYAKVQRDLSSQQQGAAGREQKKREGAGLLTPDLAEVFVPVHPNSQVDSLAVGSPAEEAVIRPDSGRRGDFDQVFPERGEQNSGKGHTENMADWRNDGDDLNYILPFFIFDSPQSPPLSSLTLKSSPAAPPLDSPPPSSVLLRYRSYIVAGITLLAAGVLFYFILH